MVLFVEETDRMHQALDTLPHRNFIFPHDPGWKSFLLSDRLRRP